MSDWWWYEGNDLLCRCFVVIRRKLYENYKKTIGKTNIRKLQEKWKKTIWRVTSQNTRLMVIRQVFGGDEEVFSVEGKPWEKYFLWDENLGWASTNQHLVIIRQGLLGGGQWPCSFIFHVLVVKELNIQDIRTTGVQQVCESLLVFFDRSKVWRSVTHWDHLRVRHSARPQTLRLNRINLHRLLLVCSCLKAHLQKIRNKKEWSDDKNKSFPDQFWTKSVNHIFNPNPIWLY